MAALPKVSPRTEKTVRLVSICALAAGFGITAVALDSEVWGYIASAIVLVGILVGPLTSRVFTRRPPP